MSPLNVCVEILILKAMALGGGGLWEVIKSWERTLMNEISALRKETSERSLATLTIWGYSKKAVVCGEVGYHQTQICPSHDLGFPSL